MSVHNTNTGILSGCGCQKIGAYVNLASFYLVGVPCAVLFAFILHMRAKVKITILCGETRHWHKHVDTDNNLKNGSNWSVGVSATLYITVYLSPYMDCVF